MGHIGFSYIGLIYLLMLFIPNIIWTKHKPAGYDFQNEKMNYNDIPANKRNKKI